MKFKHALTRQPGQSYRQAITSAQLGLPDLTLALRQHESYCEALQQAGLQVEILPALEDYPDSVFIEDTAIVEKNFAVVTRPGALSRRGEATLMLPVLQERFKPVYQINGLGTLDGGDVCNADGIYFLGISARTNHIGTQQLTRALNYHGFITELIDIRQIPGILHLKSAVNYLDEDTLLLDPRLADHPSFAHYRRLVVPIEEAYAANSLRVNQSLLVPDGFPRTLELVTKAGFAAITLDVSEYRKMDGGLSCLSLRW